MNAEIIVISSPNAMPSERKKVVLLLKSGLQQFHIRKPHFDDFDMMNYISSIPKEYRKYLVLHSHYHFAKDFNVKGIQVGVNTISEAKEYRNDFKYFGYSAHTFAEIVENKEAYTHFFLSPIFNSISKTDYVSNFTSNELSSFLQKNSDVNIVALGGIDKTKSKQCIDFGFKGIAMLGAIWQQEDPLTALNEIREVINVRPYALSIAGFDPSSGAGITADIKTFEQHKVQGLGVNTAITYQNENEFLSVDWFSFEQIKKQINVLFSMYHPAIVKIGLLENFKVLKQVISFLKGLDRDLKIIWDPILKASANFGFHDKIDTNEVLELLKDIYIVTPNIPECKALFGTDNTSDIQNLLNKQKLNKVLLKGGHSLTNNVSDVLIEKNSITHFDGQRLTNRDKHGTGCVFSSAICSNLANGMELQASIKKAKQYITSFIDSNSGMLGYHNPNNN